MAVFLESMQETQVELSDHENELFETLLEMLRESHECVFTVAEITEKLRHDEGVSEKAIQTWVGKTITQLGLYKQRAGRRERKRAYLFNLDHVKNVYNRYTTQISGFSGQVVSAQQIQGIPGDRLKNTGGIEVVSGDDSNATKIPLAPPVPLVTTYPKTGGRAGSLTGQGESGGVPPVPLKNEGN